jgi:multicomponent K+:H+ antiporter subunit E
MTRLLPFPFVTGSLFILWLLLNQTLSPRHLIIGAIAAIAGGWALRALQPPKARVRRAGAAFRLSALALADIIRSNFAVAGIVLGLGGSEWQSGFVDIPLQLRDQYGLAVLACIITSTPGTLWVDFDDGSGTLTIHVLDLVDENEWIRTIKGRYERLLLEIFA